MFRNVIEFFDVFLRKLNIFIIVIAIAFVFVIDYKLYEVLGNKNQVLSNNLTTINELKAEIKKDENDIQSLQQLKTNVLYLANKVDAINIIKTVLTQHNIDFTMNINVPSGSSTGSYFKGLSGSTKDYIQSNEILSKNAKMGVFQYIPTQIVIKDYINYDNLESTIHDLIKNNFIITQIASKASFGKPQELILGGRLYVNP